MKLFFFFKTLDLQLFSVLYLGSAGGAWTVAAFMTGSRTRVAAVWTWQCAGLLAATFRYALCPVAQPPAAVHFTRQHLITCQATRDVLQMTWDVAALLRVKEKNATFIAVFKGTSHTGT